MLLVLSCDNGDEVSQGVGQGGSMTRFAISEDHLYVVNNATIQVYEINGGSFKHVKDMEVDFGLETITTRDEFLYLGARDAMYIYSITDRANPEFVFRYTHIVSCDPVVVQGNRAYVTLRSGNECGGGVNQLDIIDISDPNEPQTVMVYPMESPGGLGVDGNLLFVCEGEHGLKMFDISDEKNMQLVTAIDSIHAYDVIPRDGVLILTGQDGVFQFSYPPVSDSLVLLSKIPVLREEF